MTERDKGALPDTVLRRLVESRMVSGADPACVNPASIDVQISSEIYRTQGAIFPLPNQRVEDTLPSIEATPYDLSKPLERGVVYYIRLKETTTLEGVYGYCNPKSSTGRDDVHVRVLADYTQGYDSVPSGKKVSLWLVVVPKSFPIILSDGERLAQVRIFSEDTRFPEWETRIAINEDGLLLDARGKSISYEELAFHEGDGSVPLTIHLKKGIVGWRAKPTQKVLDYSKGKNSHNPKDYFEPVSLENGKLLLRKDDFFILRTEEFVRLPPWVAAEVVSMNERMGEFRNHYAGYVDPGWGYGKSGEGKGRPITLEVRAFEDTFLRPGQPIAKMKFERMARHPEGLYDETGNYAGKHKIRLSKRFQMD